MTHIFLTPVDVWLFRDGKPFAAGEDHRAESLFPPLPLTTQGAIRSKELAVQGVKFFDKHEVVKAVGTSTDYGSLQLAGPFLAKFDGTTVTRYFPQPADAYTVNTEEHKIRPASAPIDVPKNIKTSAGQAPLLGFSDPLVKGESRLWLDENKLMDYLGGQTVTATPAAALFSVEPNPGIQQDTGTRTVVEGQLFEVEYVRLEPGVGLLLEMEGYDFSGWKRALPILQLGGEARAAEISEVVGHAFPVPSPLPRRFKIFFATPAYFTEGHLPVDWSKFFTGEVNLKAAATYQYMSIGGFDLAASEHKSSRRFLPAGSVLYFESDGNANLAQDAITEYGDQIGFGQVIISKKGW